MFLSVKVLISLESGKKTRNAVGDSMLCHCTALARSFVPQEHSSVELYYALSNDQRWGISFRFVHVFLLTASFAAITVMFINAHVCAELPIIRTLGTMRTKMFGLRCRAKKSKKDDAL